MNFHRRPTGAKAVTPQTLIQMTFDSCAGDRQAAALEVRDAARTNASLLDYLADVGARTVVGNLICSDRSKAFTGRPDADVTRPLRMQRPDTTAHERRTRGRAGLEVRLLLDARLSNGKRMAEATGADINDEIAVYEPQARNMMAKVNYFRLVVARLPDGKVVGDVLDNAALTKMWAAASEQIPA